MSKPLYVTREQLSALVRRAQECNDVTGLVPVLWKIADGYVAAKFPPDTLDPEEVAQHLCLNVHRHVHKLDPTANCFNYLTKITNRICQDLAGKDARWKRNRAVAYDRLPAADRRRGRPGTSADPMPPGHGDIGP